ncbi:hypothetical protein L226DRAFT_540422 [Lentinus tigrinus ALCF2SS1-7]|uniref:Uncharacterized protein n=1 Tax=Lentinus tigrinus ALCF2SS1-6 TaxID=1328759 RepID=A0A5C2RUF1_9APHY|nr:hypothetical protein L227DRAFT_581072 [Lentinus tigrinus ALCF2SS1-6]RPD68695.1 hypothetical protein L226DRAFT_540422 [Lentinus tigrinus ALCF2SS1-7]
MTSSPHLCRHAAGLVFLRPVSSSPVPEGVYHRSPACGPTLWSLPWPIHNAPIAVLRPHLTPSGTSLSPSSTSHFSGEHLRPSAPRTT